MMLSNLKLIRGFRAMRGSRSAPAAAAERISRAVRPVVEQLEERRLLSVSLSEGVLTITGTSGADRIDVWNEANNGKSLHATVNNVDKTFQIGKVNEIVINSLAGSDTVYGGGAGDALPGIDLVLNGGTGNDFLLGSASHATVRGGGGNDTIIGGKGFNTLIAGSGDDKLIAGHAGDVLVGGTGHDRFYTGKTRAKIVGLKEGDVIKHGMATVDSGNAGVVVAGARKKRQPRKPVPTPTPNPTYGSIQPIIDAVSLNLPVGITPQQMRTAYGVTTLDKVNLRFPQYTNTGENQDIVIIITFNPNLQADLDTFDKQFNLLPTTLVLNTPSGNNQQNFFDPNGALEAALDVEWAHVMAPKAKITVEFADSLSARDLQVAINAGIDLLKTKGGVMSMSFGADESRFSQQFFGNLFGDATRNGLISFLASSGDTSGQLSNPAVDPHVTAVGGTTLNVDAQGVRQSEFPWGIEPDFSGGGGGISQTEPIPVYQQGLTILGTAIEDERAPLPGRAVPDISLDANPSTGVPVFDSTIAGGWITVGGTSLSCPMFAGMVSLANELRAVSGTGIASLIRPIGQNLNGQLYNINKIAPSSNFFDVTQPDPGRVPPRPVGIGYDLATGLGTPFANNLIPSLAGFVSNPVFQFSSRFIQDLTISPPPLNSGDATTNFFGSGSVLITSTRVSLSIGITGNDGFDPSDFANIIINNPIKRIGASSELINGHGTAIVQIDGVVFNLPLRFKGTINVVKKVSHINGEFFTVDAFGNKLTQGAQPIFFGTFSQ